MDIDKLNKWADLLLDTGKRNNLINFRDSKLGNVEVVSPDFASLFFKAAHSATFEVFDPKLDNEEDDEEIIETSNQIYQSNNYIEIRNVFYFSNEFFKKVIYFSFKNIFEFKFPKISNR